MYVLKTDRRCKLSERTISTTVWHDRDDEGIKYEADELSSTYPASEGYRIVWYKGIRTQ
jgi:hypothetical protein